MNIDLVAAHHISSFDGKVAILTCGYTGEQKTVQAESLVLVTARSPNDGLYQALAEKIADGSQSSSEVPETNWGIAKRRQS